MLGGFSHALYIYIWLSVDQEIGLIASFHQEVAILPINVIGEIIDVLVVGLDDEVDAFDFPSREIDFVALESLLDVFGAVAPFSHPIFPRLLIGLQIKGDDGGVLEVLEGMVAAGVDDDHFVIADLIFAAAIEVPGVLSRLHEEAFFAQKQESLFGDEIIIDAVPLIVARSPRGVGYGFADAIRSQENMGYFRFPAGRGADEQYHGFYFRLRAQFLKGISVKKIFFKKFYTFWRLTATYKWRQKL